ncbi:TPA: hypothetical protein N0F65_009217 [Lagenidium giganteum]|uniref:Uncharacterized protein n=1 Tax=Lagenidium giganteum TaxID=4803 RepID=A0AAV2YTG8_9STRA|nr:TPA: hypothetical protein N0F65_009217 [Lagenidium giganteum]
MFDDWSNDQIFCKNHVVPFYICGRRKGLTTLFLCHASHQGTPNMVRLNSEVLMILRSPSKADLKAVLRDMPISGMTDDMLWRLYSLVTRNRDQMLLINTVTQQVRYNGQKILYDGTKNGSSYIVGHE